METPIGYKDFSIDVHECCKELFAKYNFKYLPEKEDFERYYSARFRNKSVDILFYIQFPYERANYSFVKNGFSDWMLQEKVASYLKISPEEERNFFKMNYSNGTPSDIRDACRKDLHYIVKELDHFYSKILSEDFNSWNDILHIEVSKD
jgi:hypothetical protein